MGLNNNIRIAFKTSFDNRCMELITASYYTAIIEKSISIDWNENDITAQLHEYIDCNPLRIKWAISTNVEHHLPKESIKKEKGFSAKFPRIDLRFTTFKSKNEYRYFLEAKNLKQTDSSLKRRYIETGINNYISKKYENGCLAGYLLEGSLDLTINGINSLLTKDKRSDETLRKQFLKFHTSYYESSHSTIGIIKHLIFDFTA
jgi:hypothetical protein